MSTPAKVNAPAAPVAEPKKAAKKAGAKGRRQEAQGRKEGWRKEAQGRKEGWRKEAQGSQESRKEEGRKEDRKEVSVHATAFCPPVLIDSKELPLRGRC